MKKTFRIIAVLLVLVLAVVDDLAHRRLGTGRDLDQIKFSLFSKFSCLESGHDAEHLTVRSDHTDFPVANLFIDLVGRGCDGKHLQEIEKFEYRNTKSADAQHPHRITPLLSRNPS